MQESFDNKQPKDVKPKPGTESNPIGQAFNIMVSIPDRLEIKMVNASILSDYEIWVFIASLLSNAVVGFWVAYATDSDKKTDSILLWNAIIFSVFFGFILFVAIRKRLQLNEKSRSIMLKTSQVGAEEQSNV